MRSWLSLGRMVRLARPSRSAVVIYGITVLILVMIGVADGLSVIDIVIALVVAAVVSAVLTPIVFPRSNRKRRTEDGPDDGHDRVEPSVSTRRTSTDDETPIVSVRGDPGWQAMLDEYGAVEFVASKRVALRLLGWLLVFLLGSVWFTFIGGATGIAAGGLVGLLCLAGMPVIVARLITGRPTLSVDAEGMSFGRQQVSWREVTGVETSGWARKSQNLCIRLTSEADTRVKGQLNPVHRFIERRNEKYSLGPSMTVLNVSGFDPETMAVWLEGLRRKSTGN